MTNSLISGVGHVGRFSGKEKPEIPSSLRHWRHPEDRSKWRNRECASFSVKDSRTTGSILTEVGSILRRGRNLKHTHHRMEKSQAVIPDGAERNGPPAKKPAPTVSNLHIKPAKSRRGQDGCGWGGEEKVKSYPDTARGHQLTICRGRVPMRGNG